MVYKIVNTVSPETIILFGSYAKGGHTEESDLDIVVIWDSDIFYEPTLNEAQNAYKVAIKKDRDSVLNYPNIVKRHETGRSELEEAANSILKSILDKLKTWLKTDSSGFSP